MISIRGSEVYDFLRCRLRWKYRWIDEIEPKRQDNKLYFGSMFHKFLEVYYKTKNPVLARSITSDVFENSDTSGMEQVEIDELVDLLDNVIENYVKHWRDTDDTLDVIATELTFSVPLTSEINYTGTIDLIYKDKFGKMWFADHKTTDSISKYERNIELDAQISRYWWALERLAEGYGEIQLKDGSWIPIRDSTLSIDKPHGFVYNLVLKDYPRPPKLLKRGGLSQDKSQKTTFELYMKAIEENDLAVWDYEEMLNYLKELPNQYFKRIPVYRSPQEIKSAMRDFEKASDDVYGIRIESRLTVIDHLVYRNRTTDCSWDCQYKSLCVAEMDDSNVDMIKDMLYRPIQKESQEDDI